MSVSGTFASSLNDGAILDLDIVTSSDWINDTDRVGCGLCDRKFNPFLRKHHCRACGEIICSKCSRFKQVRVAKMGVVTIRSCLTCIFKAVPSTNADVKTKAAVKVNAELKVKADVKAKGRSKSSGFKRASKDKARSSTQARRFAENILKEKKTVSIREKLSASLSGRYASFNSTARTVSMDSRNSISPDPRGNSLLMRTYSKEQHEYEYEEPVQDIDSLEADVQSLRMVEDKPPASVKNTMVPAQKQQPPQEMQQPQVHQKVVVEPVENNQNWPRAPLLSTEPARLASLLRYKILDSKPDDEFTSLSKMAATSFNCPVAGISFMDKDRQWFKSSLGIAQSELPREVSLCAHVVQIDSILIVLDTTKDDRFAMNPLVRGGANIRFYASAPIHSTEGYVIGTVVVMDTEVRSNVSMALLNILQDLSSATTKLLEEQHGANVYRPSLQLSMPDFLDFDTLEDVMEYSPELSTPHAELSTPRDAMPPALPPRRFSGPSLLSPVGAKRIERVYFSEEGEEEESFFDPRESTRFDLVAANPDFDCTPPGSPARNFTANVRSSKALVSSADIDRSSTALMVPSRRNFSRQTSLENSTIMCTVTETQHRLVDQQASMMTEMNSQGGRMDDVENYVQRLERSLLELKMELKEAKNNM